jgi:hypothetical protein
MSDHYDVVIFTDMNTKFWHSKPLGAYRVATELRKHGYATKVIDYFGSWLDNPELFYELLDLVISEKTLFLGFSGVFFTPNKTPGSEIIKRWQDYEDMGELTTWPLSNTAMSEHFAKIRELYPNLKLVYGGTNSALKVKQLVNDMDFIVKGLADVAVIELADHLSKQTTLKYMPSGSRAKVIDYDTKATAFDFRHSIVQYEKTDHIQPGEVLTLETSRGCLFKCSFCGYPLIGRKKGDPDYHKTVDAMAIELKKNWTEYGVDTYMFVDETFNETTTKIENVLRARDIAGVNLKFGCYLRIDLVARFPEQLQLLKQLGLVSAFMGIESFHKPSAMAIGKSTDPERVKETLFLMKQTIPGIKLIGGLIIGLPYDNPETLETWVPWVISQDCPIDMPRFNPLYVEGTNSDIAKNPGNYGYTLYFDEASGKTLWRNQWWDQTQAKVYALKAMEQCWDTGRIRLATWDLLGMQNYGYGPNDFDNISIDQLDFVGIGKKKQQQWQTYQDCLWTYETQRLQCNHIR